MMFHCIQHVPQPLRFEEGIRIHQRDPFAIGELLQGEIIASGKAGVKRQADVMQVFRKGGELQFLGGIDTVIVDDNNPVKRYLLCREGGKAAAQVVETIPIDDRDPNARPISGLRSCQDDPPVAAPSSKQAFDNELTVWVATVIGMPR